MALDMDYIDVAARIVEFRTKHPEGSLQPADHAVPFQVVELAGQTYIAVVAAAYRTPDDPRPGIGMAYEPVPGKTNFTRGSELQNAETSAWGRAIVAAMAGDTKRSIASADEVRNRQADRESERDEPGPEAIDLFAAIVEAKDEAALRKAWETLTEAREHGRITERESVQLNAHVKKRKAELEAGNDSTSDGDRGGVEPGPAVERPGPDSQGAGVGGPGLGGEEGGGGPGVQPRVHGRDRVDRGTQAHSGDRDTPAEAGR